MSELAALFPDGDYRFHLTLRRGEPAEFFRPRDPAGSIVAERARWIAAAPARYAALTPEGEPLRSEFAALALEWGACDATAAASIATLGAALEPDVLFLSADAAGDFRLRGGALCFPTGWALKEKIGHSLDFIHGVVPGLNPALASPIRQFLAKLKPGVAYVRDNWGLAAHAELNAHPSRSLPAPTPPVALDRLWLRVEHQALLALPRSGGIAFGIRIALHRLDELAGDAAVISGLKRALASMAPELAAYKRLAAIRAELLARL
ncbi:MAG TPA: heme-dependent oxidative N-demethylase subunit alpha family protein [Opitutaceae bacterium]|nr:heme-dependent oxidative N-demethylase subunit alpha family protein [Opitutaceae bacterium]